MQRAYIAQQCFGLSDEDLLAAPHVTDTTDPADDPGKDRYSAANLKSSISVPDPQQTFITSEIRWQVSYAERSFKAEP